MQFSFILIKLLLEKPLKTSFLEKRDNDKPTWKEKQTSTINIPVYETVL